MNDYTLESKAKQVALSFDLDPKLVCAICKKESDWNPYAMRFEPKFYADVILPLSKTRLIKLNPAMKSGIPTKETERVCLASSYGLMQILGQTARELGYRNTFTSGLFDIDVNLNFGCMYLKQRVDKYPDIRQAISAYNAGSPIKSNRKYVDDVLSLMELY